MHATKPTAPAMLGAATAALAVLLLSALLVLLRPDPTTFELDGGTIRFTLPSVLHVLGSALAGTYCPTSDLIGLDCRIGPAAQYFTAAARAPAIRASLIMWPIAAACAGLFSFLSIYSATPRRELEQTVKGRRPVFDADGHSSLRGAIAMTGRPSGDGLWLAPHVQLTPVTESYNMLALGAQGSGKSSLIRALTEQCVERGDRLFVHDVKGDMTAGIPIDRGILVAPHDSRSWAYDIAADIHNMQHAREFAAHAVPTSLNDPMWGKGAQAIWADLVMALARRTGGKWSWPDLAAVLLAPGTEIKDMLEAEGAASASRLIFEGADPGENRTTMSLLITVWVAAMTVVLPLADAWAMVPETRRFSLSRWVERRKGLPATIILQRSSEYPALSTAIGGFLIDRLAGLAMGPGRLRSRSGRIVLCLDELPELGPLERLPSLLNLGRELGLVTIAGIQDIAHLVEVYGDELAEVILARFRIKLVHQLESGDTANRVSQLLGEREILRRHPSDINPRTGKPALARESVPVFEADLLSSELGVRHVGGRKIARVLIAGLGNPAIVEVPVTGWAERRAGHVPAAWLSGIG